MTDKLVNFYKVANNGKEKKIKFDKDYKKHYIQPNSMIMSIGGTGSGKSNSLVNLLDRKRNWTQIHIYSGSTTDEPLLKFLDDKIDGVEFYDKIEDVPDLKEFDDDDKESEKLIVFDDFVDLNKKEMKKINEYVKSGRKFGFTVFLCVQNYTQAPKAISRNCHYFIVFRLNDNVSINNIIRNHNVDNIDKEFFKDAYVHATSEPLNFFMVDLKGDGITRLRHNFLNFYKTK